MYKLVFQMRLLYLNMYLVIISVGAQLPFVEVDIMQSTNFTNINQKNRVLHNSNLFLIIF